MSREVLMWGEVLVCGEALMWGEVLVWGQVLGWGEVLMWGEVLVWGRAPSPVHAAQVYRAAAAPRIRKKTVPDRAIRFCFERARLQAAP
jgi:hypothetical protein